jgi:uncharacterized membrane protein YphA (DoxX/SURF4 family)
MEESLVQAAEISLAGVLIVAGLAKQRVNSTRASGLALAGLAQRISDTIAMRSVSRLWRTVGGIEVVTGIALLVPTLSQKAALAASALLAVGLVYLVVAQKLAPGRACGCFGTGGRITERTALRCVYLLGWAGFAASESTDRTEGAHGSPLALLAFATVIVFPIVATSLAWRGTLPATRKRWSQLVRFIRARVTSPEVALGKVRASDVWQAMSEEAGVPLQELATVDTWMEGDWRVWELSDPRASSGVHLIVGRYLGTGSTLTRLMLYEGPVEADKYLGTWDSRLIGLEALAVSAA